VNRDLSLGDLLLSYNHLLWGLKDDALGHLLPFVDLQEQQLHLDALLNVLEQSHYLRPDGRLQVNGLV